MDHKQLCDLVHGHFAKLVANAKTRIDNEGPLSATMQAQLLDNIKSAGFDLPATSRYPCSRKSPSMPS